MKKNKTNKKTEHTHKKDPKRSSGKNHTKDHSKRGSFGTKKSAFSQSKAKTKETFRVEGLLHVSASGKGFLTVADGEKDLLIEKDHLNTGLNGDTVRAVVRTLEDGESETRVEEVLTRKKMSFVGTLEESLGVTYLKPQDPRMYIKILIPKERVNGAEIGQRVFGRVLAWSDPRQFPEGEILQVIGTPNDHETEMMAVLLDKGILSGFDKETEDEAKAIKADEPNILAEALKIRKDMRSVTTFTIDPESAKDFDDALSYQTLPDGDIEIGVHIADVSHFVQPGSFLDTSAVRRGTSVYLVDRTIPMLPEILSNDLCSLNPNEDKLAFSVLFTFTPESIKESKPFHLKKTHICKTVINSDKRFSYESAQKIIDDKAGLYVDELLALNVLGKKIAQKNKEDGAISFSQEEVRFVLDENKKPIDVRVKKTIDTNSLIESFMLLANRSVTEFIQRKVPKEERLFLYRIHDRPDQERIVELMSLLHTLGYSMCLKDGTISSDELNNLLRDAEGKPEANMIQMATIRSMAKAIYSIQNIGHFGLAFENYTHFTSPIRRYPDVIVHRLIKTYMDGKRIPQAEWHVYQSLAQELSDKEKSAMEAERGSIKFKQAEYMLERVGTEREGVITGVTEWGIFIEDSKSKCEGMIRIKNLGDEYFTFQKEKLALVGEKTGTQYRLGDTVKMKVKNVDLENKQIEYVLI